ncbi:NADH-quinone oxidoreductase subunit B family protein [Desulfopila aestuarii]|uniref:NAD(P)-dependent nickel-iron dehydrogenase subunit HoxY n=1 Tax=Desulfopila aestuarii DSM 18488 TaxID=1121416 RepID=A0A1M7YKQ7_9BACT|nr:NADP oxidoreductase [Desulfopila aestuarii]SHO53207.1 NAD(P)-dependent nickel-iron dehydrogenase subunit HoxY [Desulfopila aestuarii DSM 18488]
MAALRPRIATVWLDGCSGCHMSLLDGDERLMELAEKIDLVYGPLVDTPDFPEEVEITLVEGGVSTDDDIRKLRLLRKRSNILVSFGDCAVTANVPGMRNEFRLGEVLQRAYLENVSWRPSIPVAGVPVLKPHVRPLHEYVEVDAFLPGCPPPAMAIWYMLSELIEGRLPELGNRTRFGA